MTREFMEGDQGLAFGNRMMFMKKSKSSTTVTAGTLHMCGNNYYKQTGLNQTYSSPVQLGTATNWSQVAIGSRHGMGIRKDGTLWALGGLNDFGGLGLGNTSPRSSPVQVGSLSTWATLDIGNNFGGCCGPYSYNTIATRIDGTLWTWGPNSSGQLGIGSFTSYSSPVQVGNLSVWSMVAAGISHCCAIQTDQTLWAWGNNYQGLLGLGNTTDRSSPTQVGTLSTWAAIAADASNIFAIRTDGTLWGMGRNIFGQLGTGDTIARSSPTQIGSLSQWKKVSFGGMHVLATRVDGTLWSFGYNNSGALGDGSTVSRSSPVQIGSLSNWQQISALVYSSAAIRSDGSVWVFGSNGYGQLGLGDIISRSSPVQVGALTQWISLAKKGSSLGLIKG